MENKRNDYKLSLHWLNEQSLLFILYGKITHIPFKQRAVEIAFGCKVMLRKFATKLNIISTQLVIISVFLVPVL